MEISMTETPEAAHERRMLRWDGTVTAGNVLTAIAMLTALLAWGFRLEAQADRAHERLMRLESARERDDRETAGLRELTAGMRSDLSGIQRSIARVEALIDQERRGRQ
jgi:hypothetical protein